MSGICKAFCSGRPLPGLVLALKGDIRESAVAPYVRMVSSSSEAKASSIENVLDVMLKESQKFTGPSLKEVFFLSVNVSYESDLPSRGSSASFTHRFTSQRGGG